VNILILGTKILAVDVMDCGDVLRSKDISYPKDVIPGWAVVDSVTLPGDYAPGRYSFVNGMFVGMPAVPHTLTNDEIKVQLATLDLKRIRPLAEGDAAFLITLNAQVTALRKQLK
jgi:hypothetical protein